MRTNTSTLALDELIAKEMFKPGEPIYLCLLTSCEYSAPKEVQAAGYARAVAVLETKGVQCLINTPPPLNWGETFEWPDNVCGIGIAHTSDGPVYFVIDLNTRVAPNNAVRLDGIHGSVQVVLRPPRKALAP